MKVWKLTDSDMKTFGGTSWRLDVPLETSGQGELCSAGWLHFYQHPLLAVLLNPLHANYKRPRLFEADAAGMFLYDRGLKAGATKLTLVREVPVPSVTLMQRVAFAEGCAAWAKEAAVGPRLNADEILTALSHIAEEAVK